MKNTLALITLLFIITGCSDSSDSSPANNSSTIETEIQFTSGSSELTDPNEHIANIVFESAQKDAKYQCLLEAVEASAASDEIQAYPVVQVDDSTSGVFATWCKLNETDSEFGNDNLDCERGLNLTDDLESRGAKALTLFTSNYRSGELEGQAFGYTLLSEFNASGTDQVDLSYARGFNTSPSFSISFGNYLGNARYSSQGSIASSYSYRDGNDVVADYEPPETVAEQLAILQESQERFLSYINGNWDSLFEIVFAQTQGNAAWTERATARLNEEKTTLTENIDQIYPTIMSQISLSEQCE